MKVLNGFLLLMFMCVSMSTQAEILFGPSATLCADEIKFRKISKELERKYDKKIAVTSKEIRDAHELARSYSGYCTVAKKGEWYWSEFTKDNKSKIAAVNSDLYGTIWSEPTFRQISFASGRDEPLIVDKMLRTAVVPGTLEGFTCVITHEIYSHSVEFQKYDFMELWGSGIYLNEPQAGDDNIQDRPITSIGGSCSNAAGEKYFLQQRSSELALFE